MHDPETGEIIEAGQERVATGEIVQTTAHTAGMMIDMLEDGQYSADVQAALQRVAATMTDITNATGNRTKGRVTLTIDLTKEGEAFTIQAKVAEKTPEIPRPRSIMWTNEAGAFTRFPPNQTQMFGGRAVRRV